MLAHCQSLWSSKNTDGLSGAFTSVSPSLGGDARRSGFVAQSCGCCGVHLSVIPFFKFLGRKDPDRRFHVVMAGSTKLATRKFEVARTLNSEPHPGDCSSWHGILIHPEPGDIKGMDDVSGVENEVNRLSDRDDEFC